MISKHLLRVFILAIALSVAGFAQSDPAAIEASSAQQQFRITPVRPIEELRAEALKAKPPEEDSRSNVSLVDLAKLDAPIHFDIRYATSNNVFGAPLYEQARAFLQASAAEALTRISRRLMDQGLGLLVYDAYRPWYVTKIMWDATAADKREFVADPAKGSRHNRGCAVDVTMYTLKTWEPVAMPSGYDEMSPRAYADYAGANPAEKKNREILRRTMLAEGFVRRSNEWWHFDYKDCDTFSILNQPFPPPPSPEEDEKAITIPPRVLFRVPPEFPPHWDNWLRIRVSLRVGTDGRPHNIHVFLNPNPLNEHVIQDAVENAVRQWRFEPAKRNGKPLEKEIQLQIGA